MANDNEKASAQEMTAEDLVNDLMADAQSDITKDVLAKMKFRLKSKLNEIKRVNLLKVTLERELEQIKLEITDELSA